MWGPKACDESRDGAEYAMSCVQKQENGGEIMSRSCGHPIVDNNACVLCIDERVEFLLSTNHRGRNMFVQLIEAAGIVARMQDFEIDGHEPRCPFCYSEERDYPKAHLIKHTVFCESEKLRVLLKDFDGIKPNQPKTEVKL